MGMLGIAALCVLAAMACRAASADDLPHWKPGKRTLSRIDFAFLNAGLWHGSPPGLEKLSRYYAGITIKGRRMVRAEFTAFTGVDVVNDQAHYDPPEVRVVPEDHFPVIFDGGCGVVNMLFDVAADRLVWIQCNGLA